MRFADLAWLNLEIITARPADVIPMARVFTSGPRDLQWHTLALSKPTLPRFHPLCDNSPIHGGTMMKRLLTVAVLIAALFVLAQAAPPSMKSAPAPDRAYLQKIWDGWATLNPDNVAQYYATGAHPFFDIAPLKYNSWEEYDKGAKALLSNYKSATFTVNDDLAIHPAGDLAWVTATVKYEMTQKTGKVEMGNMRWTAVYENRDGKWIAVHEHVSMPVQ
jgi:ketosteroid isomerase-like protein